LIISFLCLTWIVSIWNSLTKCVCSVMIHRTLSVWLLLLIGNTITPHVDKFLIPFVLKVSKKLISGWLWPLLWLIIT
jgi:hypothetical protein